MWRLSLAHGNVRTKDVDHVLILFGVSVCCYLLSRGKNGSIIVWVLLCLVHLTLFAVHLFSNCLLNVGAMMMRYV